MRLDVYQMPFLIRHINFRARLRKCILNTCVKLKTREIDVDKQKLGLVLVIAIFMLSLGGCASKNQHDQLYKQKPGFYSYIIGDVNSDKIYLEKNSEVYATPASCQKVITAILALKELGPEYRYETSLLSNKKDIVIKFSGDPSFTSEQLTTLLAPLRNSKIKGILSLIIVFTKLHPILLI